MANSYTELNVLYLHVVDMKKFEARFAKLSNILVIFCTKSKLYCYDKPDTIMDWCVED